jgi:hypothetical protein
MAGREEIPQKLAIKNGEIDTAIVVDLDEKESASMKRSQS